MTLGAAISGPATRAPVLRREEGIGQVRPAPAGNLLPPDRTAPGEPGARPPGPVVTGPRARFQARPPRSVRLDHSLQPRLLRSMRARRPAREPTIADRLRRTPPPVLAVPPGPSFGSAF